MTLEELMTQTWVMMEQTREIEDAADQLCHDLTAFDPATICQAIDIALTSPIELVNVADQIHNLVEGETK